DAVEAFQRGNRVLVCRSGVDHRRLAELPGERELALEEHALRVPRGVVAEVVEAGLADRDRTLVREQAPELVEIGLRTGLVRVDPETGVDAVVRLGERERRSGLRDGRRDCDDALDTRRTRTLEHRRRLRGIEVRMRVD